VDLTILNKEISYTPVQRLALLLAAGFGSGWLPKAPGTFGSLASLLPAWLLLDQFGFAALILALLLLLPLACWSTRVVLPLIKDKDPGWIVIDEWLGQWLTLLIVLPLLQTSWWSFALCFAAFRVFDIWKPGPVRRAEHLGPAWWSIHGDDLLAGLFAGLSLAGGYGLISVFGSGL